MSLEDLYRRNVSALKKKRASESKAAKVTPEPAAGTPLLQPKLFDDVLPTKTNTTARLNKQTWDHPLYGKGK